MLVACIKGAILFNLHFSDFCNILNQFNLKHNSEYIEPQIKKPKETNSLLASSQKDYRVFLRLVFYFFRLPQSLDVMPN